MIKKFIHWISILVNPSPEIIQTYEAKKLLALITSRFSIEEQNEIIHKLKQELISHREKEIVDTEKHLIRLQTNLSTIQLVLTD